MGDRCYSTLVCAERHNDIFEKVGYRADESKALSVDGNEIPGAFVMVDEDATYDELTALTGVPFLVCNALCPGALFAPNRRKLPVDLHSSHNRTSRELVRTVTSALRARHTCGVRSPHLVDV